MARRHRSPRPKSGKSVKRTLLINAREANERRIAVVEDGRLEEYYLERQSLGSTLGNIYQARVSNVEKSIGAAFVEFGHSRQGFLHVTDLAVSFVGPEAAEFMQPLQEAGKVAAEEDVVDVDDEEDHGDIETGINTRLYFFPRDINLSYFTLKYTSDSTPIIRYFTNINPFEIHRQCIEG